MKTYPILTSEGKPFPAFEIENSYISKSAILKILLDLKEVSEIEIVKNAARSDDVLFNFNYRGQAFIVWEPYGDSSRYWIGPKDANDANISALKVQQAFEKYQPSFFSKLVGDLMTLNFIKRIK